MKTISVQPEIERLRGKKILCSYGENHEESCWRDLDVGLAKVIALKGGHRIGDRFDPMKGPGPRLLSFFLDKN